MIGLHTNFYSHYNILIPKVLKVPQQTETFSMHINFSYCLRAKFTTHEVLSRYFNWLLLTFQGFFSRAMQGFLSIKDITFIKFIAKTVSHARDSTFETVSYDGLKRLRHNSRSKFY